MNSVDRPSLATLRQEIDDRLARILPSLTGRLTRLHPDLSAAAASLERFVDGGKRIRPALLQIGYWTVEGADPTAVVDPALALEFLHTCALVHDDIIDAAPSRRMRPTVHVEHAQRHEQAGWLGNSQRYGEAVAILVGDVAFVYADDLFLRCDLPAERVLAGLRAFTVLREEVMAGQFLDLHSAAVRSTDRTHALTVATLKSGRYSVTRPLEIGAVLGGAKPALIQALMAFGDPIGRAFQVRDDMLGVFGSAVTTGKSTASDFAEGKRTLLIAEAFARADEGQARVLSEGLGNSNLDEAGADRLRQVITETGARQAAERYIEESLDAALLALDQLPADPQARAVLGEVAQQLGFRTH